MGIHLCWVCRISKTCSKICSSNKEGLFGLLNKYVCHSCRQTIVNNLFPDDPTEDPDYSMSEDSEGSDDESGWLSDGEIHDVRGDPEPPTKKQKVTPPENDLRHNHTVIKIDEGVAAKRRVSSGGP
jgi:hypothetical protein